MVDGFLDTNIIIDLLRQYSPTLHWVATISNQQLAITPIVWMEVAQGSLNQAELEKAVRLMRRFRIEHSTPADNDRYLLIVRGADETHAGGTLTLHTRLGW